MKKLSLLLLSWSVLLYLPACTGFVHAQTITLKIIETTDVHGTIYPYDFINDSKTKGSLAQVHAYVQDQKAVKGQQVILLDAGDILQGQPPVYYYNFERTDVPHLYARVMNYMGYDAAAVGNHDIETSHAVYDKFADDLDFPWLSANAVSTEKQQPYFQPYTVVERAGIKIAVLGMVTPGIPNWLPPQIWSGMAFKDLVQTARHWVPVILRKERPDLLVGLFHSGAAAAPEQATNMLENASRAVAEQVAGFDVVFVGHDHRGWNLTTTGPDGNPVVVLGADSHAKNVAVATVTLDYDEAADKWDKSITGKLVDMAGVQPDGAFLQKFKPEFDEVREYVSRPIGTFTEKISTRDALFGSSAFVDIVHRIQLELTGADISISAPLSPNANIEKGPVYVRDMFNLYKFENLLYTMHLSGTEIKGFLEFSYGGWFNKMQNADDHLLNFQKDDNGALVWSDQWQSYLLRNPSYNFDSMAGIDYVVDVSKPPDRRITIKALSGGRPFDPQATYKVAINSYRGAGGGDHLTTGAGIPREQLTGRIVSSTQKDLRYFLMKWIEKTEVITPKAFGNWTVVPEKWWQVAKERDYKLLFGEQ